MWWAWEMYEREQEYPSRNKRGRVYRLAIYLMGFVDRLVVSKLAGRKSMPKQTTTDENGNMELEAVKKDSSDTDSMA